MHDLRKKALLESGKTVSRKARSKPESNRSSATHSPATSPVGSRAGSRANSRPGSRYASEDEYYTDSDVASDDDILTLSTNSDEANSEDAETDDWSSRLQDRIVEMQDRKHSSTERRESTLNAYLHLTRHHYAGRELERNLEGITQALLRSIRSGSSEREQSMALQALAVTILSTQSETVFDEVSAELKNVCRTAEEESHKVEAIYAITAAVMYGGGSEVAAEEVLDFLLEIIESDGNSVEAGDSGPVVTAALQAWSFIASHLDDLTAQSDEAMEAFIDQLDSSDPEVQTSAGASIALLFESARDYEEETGEKFDLNYNQHRIMTRMNEIVRDSSKSVAKKRRRQLRQNFSSIITSLERGKGPGYSTAGRSEVNPNLPGSGAGVTDAGFVEFGYRQKVRIHSLLVVIDTWSLQARVEILKLLLGGGFPIHFMENPVVRDILSGANMEYVPSQNSLKTKSVDSPKKKPRKARGTAF